MDSAKKDASDAALVASEHVHQALRVAKEWNAARATAISDVEMATCEEGFDEACNAWRIAFEEFEKAQTEVQRICRKETQVIRQAQFANGFQPARHASHDRLTIPSANLESHER